MKLLVAAALLISLSLQAQTPPKAPAPVKSPQVNSDRSITFRYYDPGAKRVTVEVDWLGKPIAMEKGDEGVWSYTTKPLAPQIYSYSFYTDGHNVFDPGNLNVSPNLFFHDSMVEVPGDGPQPWDATAIPHGELHRHLYTSKIIRGLTGEQEPYLVYTPPGYDEHAAKPYPVLYLLHGWSQTEASWTTNLKANLILDSLLAAGKAKPMVVVMPLGYGDMEFMESWDVWQQPKRIENNLSLFSDALRTDIIPQVEAEYHVSKDRQDRAIAGLSMGGLESLTIGLAHTDMFAWVGGMSAAVHALPYPAPLPGLDAKKADLKLLWVACGTSDGLIGANRKLVGYLKGQGLNVVAVETPGAHVSQVWRDNLLHLAPLLFQR
jgi:enterochelin esterase family protein